MPRISKNSSLESDVAVLGDHLPSFNPKFQTSF